MAKTIIIDSFIGNGGYSNALIRKLLSNIPDNEPAEIIISSLGGDVNHAVAIHDMFAERENISGTLTGFIASAATFIGLPIHTRISENSFYLIHKALSWVDEWGMMNEDDLDEVIQRLTKEKDENAKITLQLAKAYLKRAAVKGKSLQDVLNLMKLDTWLTAEEAVEEWGFVDEVYIPSKTSREIVQNEDYYANIFEFINAAGLPTPPRTQPLQNNQSNKNNETMRKTLVLQHINKVINTDELVCDDDGSFLNEDQLNNIENELVARNERITELQTGNDTLQAALTETETNVTALNDRIVAFEAIETRLSEAEVSNTHLNERIAELEPQTTQLTEELEALRVENETLKAKILKMPGARSIQLQTEKDPGASNTGVDWDAINNLPHNKFVDNN